MEFILNNLYVLEAMALGSALTFGGLFILQRLASTVRWVRQYHQARKDKKEKEEADKKAGDIAIRDLLQAEEDRIEAEGVLREATDRRLLLLDDEIPGRGFIRIPETEKHPKGFTLGKEYWVLHNFDTPGNPQLQWHCPHCVTEHTVPKTKAGNWSWSPRICKVCEIVLQQCRPIRRRTHEDGNLEHHYFVKKEPTSAGLDRIRILLDEA